MAAWDAAQSLEHARWQPGAQPGLQRMAAAHGGVALRARVQQELDVAGGTGLEDLEGSVHRDPSLRRHEDLQGRRPGTGSGVRATRRAWVRVWVRAWMRAWVRAWVRAWARAWVRVWVRAWVRAWVRVQGWMAARGDQLSEEGVKQLGSHVGRGAEGDDHPRVHALAALRHTQLAASQPHVPVPLVAVGVDHGAVAVGILVHERQRVEHPSHEGLEPRRVR